jgi:multidrug efflux pump subunit AcrA (membrane-fusion protein)
MMAIATSARRTGRWKLTALALGLIAVVMAVSAILPRAASSSGALDPALTHTIARGNLLVTVTEQGTLESSNNTEIKCKVRGDTNTVIWVIDSGTEVQPGDELVRLETLLIEEEISERTKFAHLARAAAARSQADVARAELAISEYLEGQYISQLAELQKNLAIAESRLLSAENLLDHARMMADSEYVSELEVEEREFALAQADLEVELTKTRIDVLERFTKKEQLATLRGNLNAARARYEADKERAFADEQRLQRAEEELQYCVVKAERSGLVIYPSDRAWENAPKIEAGATVHKDQVLLLMPDLSKMQVKVGIHESIIDRVKAGLPARVALPGKTLDGTISSVSPVTRPAGWWTGNVVKYDTIVELPPADGLKPGMSVEVEVIMARHTDVLTIPAAAVVETTEGYACWVQIGDRSERRPLQLGDGSHMFIVVEAGLAEGDQVVLDPLAHIPQAQLEAAATLGATDADAESPQPLARKETL